MPIVGQTLSEERSTIVNRFEGIMDNVVFIHKDENVMALIRTVLFGYGSLLAAQDIIDDCAVICEESNNKADRKDSDKFIYVDLAVKFELGEEFHYHPIKFDLVEAS